MLSYFSYDEYFKILKRMKLSTFQKLYRDVKSRHPHWGCDEFGANPPYFGYKSSMKQKMKLISVHRKEKVYRN